MINNIAKLVFSIFLLQFSINAIGQTDANVPYKGICIYIDYPDVPAILDSVHLDNIINQMDYQEPTIPRSFRKYWHDQSRRNVDIEHDVFFYTAPLPASHYDTVHWYDGISVWQDALESIIANHPNYDWNNLSLGGDGALFSAMIISTSLAPAGVGGAHFPNWTLSNGVNIKRIYGSVMQAPWDTNLNLFMTAHEAGHGIFRFPDTYDTQYDSGGTAWYCLMSGGIPEIEVLGGPFWVQNNWGHIVEPEPGTHTITLRADGDSVVVLRNPRAPYEFFIIEARKKSTLGNERFPADLGLLLWHTDYKVTTSNTLEDRTPLKHYLHSIVQADGLYELEENGLSPGQNIGDIYLPGDSFSSTTSPPSVWWAGEEYPFELNDIQFIGDDHIQFTVRIPEEQEVYHPEIDQNNWSVVSETHGQHNHYAFKAFDGDPATYYHVPWANTEPRPHEVVLDLGDEYTINELYYTPNDNFSPPWEGWIRDYEIYISNDTTNWGTAVVASTFFKTRLRQYVLFLPTDGRYFRFSAINSYEGDDVRTSIAEINLRGFLKTTVNVAPPAFTEGFKVYPNPAHDLLNIETPDLEDMVLTVFNIYGHEVVVQSLSGSSNTIDIADYPSGVYFVQIAKNESLHLVKLLKQ